MAAPPPTSRLPRWLVIASYPISALVLTLFFVFLGFPYELLAVRLSDAVERSMDLRLRIGELSPHFGLGGPGLAATEVLAGREGGRTIVLEELVLRPAWSLSWFRGVPAVQLDLTSEIGNAAGTVTLGEQGGWDGTLESVRIAYLPLEMLEAFNIDGSLNASVDLHGAGADAGGGLVGSIDFDLRGGSISGEGLPVALPFDRLHGRLLFGEDTYLTVSGVQLEGPMVAGTIEGQVGDGPTPARQPLSIEIRYEVRDPGLEAMFGSFGTRGDDGRIHVRVSGTLSKPVVR
jgi:type II secretion system protein N